MNSTLKPLLLVEVIGLQRECLSPEKLSGLFLACRGFANAFALAFRYRCTVRHKAPYNSNLIIRTNSGITFQFNKNHCIPILLQVAGRLLQRMYWQCPTEPWIEPFYEGIDQNRSLEYINYHAGMPFFRRYCEHHDTVPTLALNTFSWLDHLKIKHLDTLVILDLSRDVNHHICSITHIDANISTSNCNPLFVGPGQQLRFKNLKRITVRSTLDLIVALRMIKAMKSVEEMSFKEVRITLPNGTLSMPRPMGRLNPTVDKLWTAMLQHSGTITVDAFFERKMQLPNNEAFNYCHNNLVGYTVTQSRHHVECVIQKRAANKLLNVKVKLECWSFTF